MWGSALRSAGVAWRRWWRLRGRPDWAGRPGLQPARDGSAPGPAPAVPQVELLARPRSPAAEAYRVIRTNLEFLAPDGTLRVLVVTSPAASEGKSVTVANLAVALVQAGRRVLCVDADLRRPVQHALFGVPRSPGLSTVLVGRVRVEDALRPVAALAGLHVLPSGPLPPNPAELLGSPRFGELLACLRDRFDVVLVDAPPVLGVADATLAARHADGVLLVVRAGITRHDALVAAREALERASARVVGAVLNATRPGLGSYYYYAYGYYARRGAGDEDGGGPGYAGAEGAGEREGARALAERAAGGAELGEAAPAGEPPSDP